ncbi:MAG: hypothetical protein KDG50_03225 [Chromatiales bacterium]|nr:hypothetical protein [Chromatiales bacterium]
MMRSISRVVTIGGSAHFLQQSADNIAVSTAAADGAAGFTTNFPAWAIDAGAGYRIRNLSISVMYNGTIAQRDETGAATPHDVIASGLLPVVRCGFFVGGKNWLADVFAPTFANTVTVDGVAYATAALLRAGHQMKSGDVGYAAINSVANQRLGESSFEEIATVAEAVCFVGLSDETSPDTEWEINPQQDFLIFGCEPSIALPESWWLAADWPTDGLGGFLYYSMQLAVSFNLERLS